jgi:hypothetical protein
MAHTSRGKDFALFAADDGTPTVWMLRHIDTGGKRRTLASLLHRTMAGGMASALRLQKSQPGQVAPLPPPSTARHDPIWVMVQIARLHKIIG